VTRGSPCIRKRHIRMPRTGVTGEKGTRNFRGRSGSRTARGNRYESSAREKLSRRR